jgi:hypothetical protein
LWGGADHSRGAQGGRVFRLDDDNPAHRILANLKVLERRLEDCYVALNTQKGHCTCGAMNALPEED